MIRKPRLILSTFFVWIVVACNAISGVDDFVVSQTPSSGGNGTTELPDAGPDVLSAAGTMGVGAASGAGGASSGAMGIGDAGDAGGASADAMAAAGSMATGGGDAGGGDVSDAGVAGSPTSDAGDTDAATTGPSSCRDGILNGAETDLDCGGGTCDPCAPSKKCKVSTDCRFRQCDGGRCTPP